MNRVKLKAIYPLIQYYRVVALRETPAIIKPQANSMTLALLNVVLHQAIAIKKTVHLPQMLMATPFPQGKMVILVEM